MPQTETEGTRVELESLVSGEGVLTLALRGRLDAATTARIWASALRSVDEAACDLVVVDASAVDYCDGAGVGLLFEIERRQASRGAAAEVRGLSGRFRALLDQFSLEDLVRPVHGEPERSPILAEVGRASYGLWQDLRVLVSFVGEMCVAVVWAVGHPRRVRWRDAALQAEKVGVNALPIIVLIGFLLGVILAFQAVISLRQFGMDVFVPTIVSLSLLRELGPLIAAIVLAGRSGSAFAAELGTMKVTEELDALSTMGIAPVRFLVITRVMPALVMMPLLTVFMDLAGMVGGAIVCVWIGMPLVTFTSQARLAVGPGDLLGGLAKSVVLALLVTAVGCLRGLRTKSGPSAVGDSATSAVVSGLVLIAIAEGVLAAVYYSLGI
jgi:phospholipid/cholesterol/gamma-HCH transport system permease protein